MKLLAQYKVSALMLICISLFACEKSEGPGGTSTIRGKVITHEFDPGWNTLNEIYPEADEKVYIIYGDESTTYNDDYNSSFDGSYEFKYLQKGTYKLFIYSKDSTGAHPSGITPDRDKTVFITVKINDNGETVDAPDLIKLKTK